MPSPTYRPTWEAEELSETETTIERYPTGSEARLTLAEDSQKDQDRTQRETVTLNRGSSQEVVVTNRYYPVYQGAVVVCQGADSSAVRLAITETVQALTGLPSDRIQVAKWTS